MQYQLLIAGIVFLNLRKAIEIKTFFESNWFIDLKMREIAKIAAEWVCFSNYPGYLKSGIRFHTKTESKYSNWNSNTDKMTTLHISGDATVRVYEASRTKSLNIFDKQPSYVKLKHNGNKTRTQAILDTRWRRRIETWCRRLGYRRYSTLACVKKAGQYISLYHIHKLG